MMVLQWFWMVVAPYLIMDMVAKLQLDGARADEFCPKCMHVYMGYKYEKEKEMMPTKNFIHVVEKFKW